MSRGWHFVMFVDAFFINFFAFYASQAIRVGNVGGAMVWYRDWEKIGRAHV